MKKIKLTRAGRKFLRSLHVGMFVEFDILHDMIMADAKAWHGKKAEILAIGDPEYPESKSLVRVYNKEIFIAKFGDADPEWTSPDGRKRGWVQLNWIRPYRSGQLELFEEKREEFYRK